MFGRVGAGQGRRQRERQRRERGRPCEQGHAQVIPQGSDGRACLARGQVAHAASATWPIWRCSFRSGADRYPPGVARAVGARMEQRGASCVEDRRMRQGGAGRDRPQADRSGHQEARPLRREDDEPLRLARARGGRAVEGGGGGRRQPHHGALHGPRGCAADAAQGALAGRRRGAARERSGARGRRHRRHRARARGGREAPRRRSRAARPAGRRLRLLRDGRGRRRAPPAARS